MVQLQGQVMESLLLNCQLPRHLIALSNNILAHTCLLSLFENFILVGKSFNHFLMSFHRALSRNSLLPLMQSSKFQDQDIADSGQEPMRTVLTDGVYITIGIGGSTIPLCRHPWQLIFRTLLDLYSASAKTC